MPVSRKIRDHLRSNVVGYLALFIALGGGSFAVAALSGKERKVVKRIADAQITKRAPGLSVEHAGSAETATDAGHAASADMATTANRATTADTATDAEHATSADGLTCVPPLAGTGEMVKVGPTCVDRYEASVWSSPTGGTQYGISSDDYPCNDSGQNCSNIYARSVPGVTPSSFITWFQAQQALANSGKRLPSNAEWQTAVAGTPDSPVCNVSLRGSIENTGANTGCISRFGANDMVGNLSEWVADWVPASTTCPGWGSAGDFSSDDDMCLSGASTTATGPGVMVRGGNFFNGVGAGPFSVHALDQPWDSFLFTGFRGAR